MLPLHAVIQGPLTSPPTAGRKWPSEMNADCLPSIAATAAAARALGGLPIVSTWASTDRTQLDRVAALADIAGMVESVDPGRPEDTNGPLTDNRLRQATSAWNGLLEMERRDVTGIVVKVRTDQTVPLPLIQRFISDFLQDKDEATRDTTVFITSAHFHSLYEIDDFIFAGTLPAMKQFFEPQFRWAGFHSGTGSVHGDVVRKYLGWAIGPKLGWPAWRSFPTIPQRLPSVAWPRVGADIIDPWVQTLLNHLVPMPHEVWKGMTWRGSAPFAEWYPELSDRLWFEDRERLQREGADLFLQKWPKVFSTRGGGLLRHALDYATEVPREIRQGRATRATVLARKARRFINRRRFHNDGA